MFSGNDYSYKNGLDVTKAFENKQTVKSCIIFTLRATFCENYPQTFPLR